MEGTNNTSDDWGRVESTEYGHPRALPINKQNRFIYLIVTWALAATVILSVLGSIVLGFYDKQIPSALSVALGIAGGALASLFTHNR